MGTTFAMEVERKERSKWGKNWARFLRVLDEDRMVEAEKSLSAMLEVENLKGKSFLDVGTGSGLFSLAAMRLGAARVHSFDYDPQCVACAQELKRRYFPEADQWTIEEGSALAHEYLSALGSFDVVYAWGVFHYTGKLWQAIENAVSLVKPSGTLFIAVYNDQGAASRRWKVIKALYNRGWLWRLALTMIFIPLTIVLSASADLRQLKSPLARYREQRKKRGMSIVRDWFNWLSGHPYEFARPEDIIKFYTDHGFELIKLKRPDWRLGNNEYVFRRRPR